jgi:SPP1 gp7 family putative phage head morphogenesis protein
MSERYDKLFRQGELAADTLIRDTEKTLIREYKRALDDIRSQLAQVYAKYSQDGSLTYAEMSKYNRLNSLHDNVRDELINLTGKTGRAITKLSEDAYEAGFYRSAYAIEAGGGPGGMVSINWGSLSPETITASVQNPISGLTLSERLAVHRAEIITKIRSEITQGLIQGESYPKMAKRIKTTLDGDATKAMRVVRTEGHRNTQAGRNECYARAQAKGVDLVKVWSASLDDRTRISHAKLDGQEADKDGYFHVAGAKAQHPGGFGVAALDINCRCSVRGQIRGFAPKVRRVRGKGEQSYQTYNEWYKERV